MLERFEELLESMADREILRARIVGVSVPGVATL